MILSPGQEKAYDEIGSWLKTDSKRYVLAGYAGTGKSSIAKKLVEQVDGVVPFVSFTGKAALNLRKKGNDAATTLHKLIYLPKSKSVQRLIELRADLAKDPNNKILAKQVIDEQKNVSRPNFTLNLNSIAAAAKLIVLDEFSMLTDPMINDLESFGCKVLYLGDPAQLPPIGADNKLKPDIFLEEIHRQAFDSPILRAATTVRQGGELEFCNYGDFQYGERGDFGWDDYASADQVICGRNKNRQILNKKFRQKYGFTSLYPMVGDKLTCLRNDHEIGIMNGMIVTAQNNTEEFMNDDDSFNLECADEDSEYKGLPVWCGIFDGLQLNEHSWKLNKNLQLFDYASAITCHRAQGSEWDNVLVYDDGFQLNDRSMRRRWKYTALTRASKTVKLVKAYGVD